MGLLVFNKYICQIKQISIPVLLDNTDGFFGFAMVYQPAKGIG